MGITQQQKTQAAEPEVNPSRSDALDNEVQNKPTETTTATPAQSTMLMGALGGAYDEMNRNSPVLSKLDGWKSRISKVVNPVAFMTSADESGERTRGNYDIGVTNKSAADGFYELAKGECRAIASEIKSVLGDKSLSVTQRSHLEQMTLFMEGYAMLYENIQGTGRSSIESKRLQMAEKVNGVLLDVRAARFALDPTLFGDGFAVIDKALDDISIFVNTWSTVSASADVTSASPVMWESFLKTVERYRMILNQYGKLEEAGGDATGTSSMSMRHGVKTPEEADQTAMENGGYMAMALKSYGFYATDAAKMVDQVRDIIKKVQSGEYKTEDECIAAFRAHVGGGKASELFLKKVDNIAKAQWKVYLGELNRGLADKSTELAFDAIGQADLWANNVDNLVEQRDESMRNKDENLYSFGMNSGQYMALAGGVRDGSVKVVQSETREHMQAVDNWNAQQLVYMEEWDQRQGEYDEDARQGLVAIQDNTRLNLPYPGHFMDYDDEVLARGALSDEEFGAFNMDQAAVTDAQNAALSLQAKAQASIDQVKKLSASADDNIQDAVGYLFKAQNYLAEAKLAASYISGDHPALLAGLHDTQNQIKALEANIGLSSEALAQVRAHKKTLDDRIKVVLSTVEAYDPAMLKVPLPSATINGNELKVEDYQKCSISLSGPLVGVLKWIGGVTGQYSQATDLLDGTGDVWHKARIEAYFGIEADIWLAKAGVKLLGFFEAQKKNAEGLQDTLLSGASELGRWAYAWYYDLGSLGQRMSVPLQAAQTQGEAIYAGLEAVSDAKVDEWLAKLGKSESDMRNVHRVLSGRLIELVGKSNVLTVADASNMANQLMPIEDIVDGFEAMRAAPETEREASIGSEKQGFRKTSNSAINEATSSIAQVDAGTNDPNVKFEAGVGIEGYAGFGTPDSKMGLSLSARKVWSMSDGDGEAFDYSVKDKTVIKAKLKVGKFSGEVSYMPLDDGNSFGLSVSIPFAGGDGLDGSTILQVMAGDLKGIVAKSPKQWIELAQSKIAKREKMFSVGDMKGKGGGKVVIGGKVKLDNDWNFKSGEASFAIAVDMGASSPLVKVSYETGNKVTYKF